MKKVLLLVLSALLILSCVSCGGSKLNDTNTMLVKRIIKAADAYLDGDKNADEVGNIVYESKNGIVEEENAPLLDTYISIISMQLIAGNFNGSADLGKILEARNGLAEYVGMKKR